MTKIEQWAKEQGFEQFAKDHRAVLSNLEKWLELQMPHYPRLVLEKETYAQRVDRIKGYERTRIFG